MSFAAYNAAPTIINGTNAKAISAVYQLKQNAKINPATIDDIASAVTERPSVLTPLSFWTSAARIELRMPAALF